MQKKVLAGFAVLLVILLTSFVSGGCCSLFQLGTESGEIESFPIAPGIEGKSILYSDDFSKPNSNWDIGSLDEGEVDYYNGGYRVSVPSGTTASNISAYLHQSFQKDVIVEVDASRILGEDASKDFWAGIFVRHASDDSDGYLFEIHNDKGIGVAYISYVHQGLSRLIDGTINKHWKWPPRWGEPYHIRIDCIGDQISLYVNGYLIESVTDSSVSSGGEVGFFGGHDEYEERQYLFDNLVVYAVGEDAAATTNTEETTDWGEAVTTESSDEAKEAPTISLAIYESPIIKENICYYRVEATVTGSPNPAVSFSKDDGGGAWGSNKVQINLNYPGDTYTLEATATNSEGSAKDSITLSW